VGDSVKDATIRKILREKVVLRVGSKDEILTMEESAASRRKASPASSEPVSKGSTITVNRKDLERSLKDINKLLSEVRIRPHFKDGKSDGLSITRIKPGSVFTKLGLRNGDVVQKINDKEITSPDDVLALYDKLKSGSSVSVQIARRNRQRTLNYRFR
jgi:general secretion pathway protein C